MAVKSQVYDHPAYLAVYPVGLGTITGAAGITTKQAAFTSQIVKSVTIAATVLGTGTDTINVVKVTGSNGTNTTTSTTLYGTSGSGSYFGNFTPAVASNQVTLLQGDQWWVSKGTDATATYAVTAELLSLPLANLTV
jgi:hypothetical protein